MPESLRERRIEQEWLLLGKLAAANPEVVEVVGRRHLADSEDFEVRLHETDGIPVGGEVESRIHSHDVRLSFPRFYPTSPLEAYLGKPLVHSNIDPENGFVCLWTRHGTRETVVEALRRLQDVISWKSFNLDTEHIMQRDAEAWRAQIEESQPGLFPLPFTPIEEVLEFRREKERFRPPGRARKRLEPLT